VLIYDDLRADNEAAVRSVLRFLDVDDTVPIEPREANPTVRMRSARLHELVHAVKVGRGPASGLLKRSIKAVTPARARRSALRATERHLVQTSPRADDQQLMRELRERYRDEVVRLEEYLGCDLLERWGYGRVG
jgi:hypothetical protein